MESYEQAKNISSIYQLYETVKTQHDENLKMLEDGLQQLPQLEETYTQNKTYQAQIQTVYTGIQQKFLAVQNKVEQTKSIFSSIEKLDKQIKETSNHHEQIHKQYIIAEKELLDFQSQRKDYESQAESYHDLSVVKEKLDHEDSRIQQVHTSFTQCQSLQQDIITMNDKIVQLQTQYQNATSHFEIKQSEYHNKRKLYNDHLAGVIAQTQLVENEPCPVCGSIHHPHIATLHEDIGTLSQDVLDDLQRQCDILQKEVNTHVSSIQTTRALLANQQKQLEQKMQELVNVLQMEQSVSLDDIAKSIQTIRVSQQSAKERYTKRQKEYAILQTFLKDAEEKQQTLETQFQTYRDQELKLDKDLESLKAEKATYEKTLPYATLSDANDDLNRETKNHQHAKVQLDEIIAKTNDAKSQYDRCSQVIQQCENAKPVYAKQVQKKYEEYETVLKKYSRIADTWQNILAQYLSSQMDEMRNEVRQYNEEIVRDTSNIELLKKQIGDQKKPDFDFIQQNARTAKEKRDAQEEQFNQIDKLFDNNHMILTNMKKDGDERSLYTKRYQTINHLYQRLSGNVTGSRIDIETFVQRYYLKRILASANRRYRKMSMDQYELRMVHDDEAGLGRNRGLDLVVYSTVTGTERDVTTLSGGESFMAALALALGTADQIQARSASIRLDMMFIDEGFGSLDDNARNEAVRVLQNMAEGSKLIGIISHVSELKQSIPSQLHVTKDRNGSHVEWQFD